MEAMDTLSWHPPLLQFPNDFREGEAVQSIKQPLYNLKGRLLRALRGEAMSFFLSNQINRIKWYQNREQ